MVRKILLLAVIVFTAGVAFPQVNSNQNEINSEFQIAVNLYDVAQLPDALKIFQWVADQPANDKTTAAVLFIANIHLKEKNFFSAEKILNEFLDAYSGSKYYSEAELLLAEALKENGKEKEAIKFLTGGYANDSNENSRMKKKELIEQIFAKQFSPEEVEELLRENSDKQLTPMFLFYLTKKNLQVGKEDEAKRVDEMLRKDYPESREAKDAEKLFQHPFSSPAKESSEKIIACLLPLKNKSGEENSAGNEVLEGIKYAVHEFNLLSGNQVALMIRDTGRDSSQIRFITKELAANKNYDAIIGPLYSDETKIFLNASENLSVPIISPTATDDNLQLGDEPIYQANTSMEMHGRIMAQYLFYVESKRTMAVVYPRTGNAAIIGKNFISEFELLGGKVVYQTYHSQMLLLESAISALKKNIKGVEGIYFPLNNNLSIPVVLSALLKFGIDLPLYGNQDWFTTKGLETASALSEKLTFTSDSFIDFQDEDVAAFSKKFLETTGKEITTNNLYGYDAAKFLIKILAKAGKQPHSFEDEITNAEPYEGIHNAIEFGRGKINTYLNIIRFHQGKFELVERFRYNKRGIE